MKIRLMNVPPVVYMTNKTVFPVLSVPSHGLLYLIGTSKSPVLLILSPYELKKPSLGKSLRMQGIPSYPGFTCRTEALPWAL